MKKENNYSTIKKSDCAFFGAALILGFFVVWFLWTALKLPTLLVLLQHKDAAAWVQAFGSISAILVTAYIARRDTRARNEEKEALHKKEMRRIAFFINRSDLFSSISRLLQIVDYFPRIEKTIKRGNIKYKNIFFWIMTNNAVSDINSAFQKIDAATMMELRTSIFYKEFQRMFDGVSILESMFDDFKIRLDYKGGFGLLEHYFVMYQKYPEEILKNLDGDILDCMDNIELIIDELKESFIFIDRQINHNG